MRTGGFAFVAACTALVAAVGCKQREAWEEGKKVAHLAFRAKVGSLDPVKSSTKYDNQAQSLIYETLFQYKYLVRPFELEPLLLARMPDVSDDGLTYSFELKPGVRFQDDACFEASGGKGREMVARDVLYSMMRMADVSLDPLGWWLYDNRIVGFNDFADRMNKREDPNAGFDWDADIAGLRATGKYTFEIQLTKQFPQFMYVLAMPYTAVVPRECAEFYGKEFGSNPVGSGPFMLDSWSRGNRLVLKRNPTHHEELYPTEASEGMKELGLLEAAGKPVPFLDAIVYHVFEQDQPMWLKFRVGDLDMTEVASEYQDAVFWTERVEGEPRPQFHLREAMIADGIKNANVPLLDFIYRGFNMQDPLVGKGESAKYLRQAISLVWDTAEVNEAFYNDSCILYDGQIPPGLAGYKPGVISPYRGPNIEKAAELLAKAGYPEGKGLPTLNYEISRGGNSQEQSEMFTRQLRKIGINVDVGLNSFPELSDKLKSRKAQMFGLAWGGDYPDAENFLQLFYGPNASPGSNNFNYDNPVYNELYDRAQTLQPGPERTAIYEQMRDLVIEDVPSFGSMARVRFYIWNKRLKNVHPHETQYRWYKYLDLEEPN